MITSRKILFKTTSSITQTKHLYNSFLFDPFLSVCSRVCFTTFSRHNNQKQEETFLKSTPLTINPTSSSETVNNSSETPSPEQLKKSIFEKVKEFLKNYGATGLIFYFSQYFITLGCLYLLFQNGFLPTRSVMEYLIRLGLLDASKIDQSEKYANFAVAYIVNRLLEPFRLIMTYKYAPKIQKVIKHLRR